METTGTSLRLEMISQLLLKNNNMEPSLGRLYERSVESDVLSMHESALRQREYTQNIQTLSQ